MAATPLFSSLSPTTRAYLQLQLTELVGPVRLRSLIRHFGSLDRVRGASIAELTRVEGIGDKTAESILRARAGDDVERIVERCAALNIRILCQEDADYPAPLLNIADPPICLFVRGDLRPTDTVALAIVGTRRCSHYAREQASRFGMSLARAGFTVVSGLARGIDSHAHEGALRGEGRTIAVLGNGLATIYPPEHLDLAERIVAQGALVSELPPDVSPEAKNFPRRNRIIIGLSLGVIVVEAGKQSGALITARLAADYNREAFAIPGRIDEPQRTAGVNGLIRDGHAKLVTSLEDVLDELGDVGTIMGRMASPPAAGAAAAAHSSASDAGDQSRDSSAGWHGQAQRGTSEACPCGDPHCDEHTHRDRYGAVNSQYRDKYGAVPQEDMHPPQDAPAGAQPQLFDDDETDTPPSPPAALSPDERLVYQNLVDGSEALEQICERVALPAGRIMSVLTSLELKGLIRKQPGNRFAIRRHT